MFILNWWLISTLQGLLHLPFSSRTFIASEEKNWRIIMELLDCGMQINKAHKQPWESVPSLGCCW
jgi:hypothetical protein